MGEVTHRDLPNIRAEVFEGSDMSECLAAAARWAQDNPDLDIIGYINALVDWSPSVTVVYEELRRSDYEVSNIKSADHELNVFTL